MYYFYIKFTNNAGKDAEIFIPGTKKSNAIPSGKSLSLKFSKFKMEPANFVALSKPFERSLLLNDMPILNIKPDLDADKIVPVTITNPRKCKVKSIGDVEFQFASFLPFCVWSLAHSRPRCFVETNCEDKAPCACWCFNPKHGSLCFRDKFSVNTFAICRGNQISSPQHLHWLFHRYKSN